MARGRSSSFSYAHHYYSPGTGIASSLVDSSSTIRRKFNLDDDDEECIPGYFPVSRRAARITHAGLDDMETEQLSSRRQDQRLLNDITNKMQQLAVSGNPTIDKRPSLTLPTGVPPPTTAYGMTTKIRRYQGLPLGGPVARLRVISDGHSYRDTSDVELERPPASYESLRNRATDAKNKMHLHKTMLDRYLPISFGPENAVEYEVEYKFDELAQRMPSLDPRRPTRYYRGSSLPPSSRSSIVNKNSMESVRPGMSDTRKRLRQVICQAKKDPHYFA